jgi:hypothetical protein
VSFGDDIGEEAGDSIGESGLSWQWKLVLIAVVFAVLGGIHACITPIF